MYVLECFYPHWNQLIIHQSSPTNTYFDQRFLTSPNYSFSHYFEDIPSGSRNANGILCLDLGNIPFPDNSIDIFMTLDVFEHIFEFEKSIQEIYRVLKPGGCYIMTVPIENQDRSTEKACYLNQNKEVVHIPTQTSEYKGVKLEYHGNPIDAKGSVVTYYYGYDIIDKIKESTPFNPILFFKEHGLPQYGIIGALKEVILCLK
jgi:SAM-dependent methyltransferase